MQPLVYRRWWLTGGLLLLAAVIFLTLTPAPPGPFDDVDKTGHVIAYFVLMGWFCGVFRRHYRVPLAVALCLLGGLLELAQGYMGTRVYEVSDMLANAAGVASGWLAAGAGLGDWCLKLEKKLGRDGARRGS